MNKLPDWENDFPNGYGHTSIAFLKRCVCFEDAKNGDLDAAQFVVSRCVKHNRLCDLREKYPDAVLLPVLGRNQLPLALALAIGLPIWTHVYLLQTVSRRVLNAAQRLLHIPVFMGYIKEGSEYILVDDVITQGGTITALRRFVVARGGTVVAVVALAYAIGSHAVAPTKRTLIRLTVKFNAALILLLRMLGIAASAQGLTNSQARYLLCFASLGNIEKKLAKVTADAARTLSAHRVL
jgi:hypothetical protein